MKRISKSIRFMLCMTVILFATTTAVMGCYQTEPWRTLLHSRASALRRASRGGHPHHGPADRAGGSEET